VTPFLGWCILIAGVVVAALVGFEGWVRQVDRARVFGELDAAEFNGYFADGQYLSEATAAEIACDLTCYAPDLEHIEPEELVPHVRAWMRRREAR